MSNGRRTQAEIEYDIAAMREWVKKYKNPDPRLKSGLEWQAKRWGVPYDELVAHLMQDARRRYGDDIYDDVPAP